MYRLNLLMVLVGTTVAFLVLPARPDLFEDDSEELHRLGSTSTLGGRRHFDQFGQHDDEFDHEAVLGAHDEVEAFKELEPEEAKARLAVLVDKMDSNNNSFVEKTELRDWIISSFRNLDKESAKPQLDDKDKNRDGKLEWSEFLEQSYGYSEKEFEAMKQGDTGNSKDFIESVEQEKFKFNVADVDKNGYLDLTEYAAFVHPHNYGHMAEAEVIRTLRDFDKDKDGFISEKEFIATEKIDPETLKLEKENFKQFDLNQDGKLDRSEMIKWITPGFEANANSEMEHLFAETDANKDGKLSKKEILEQHDLWVGSHATDYGRHLDTIKTEL